MYKRQDAPQELAIHKNHLFLSFKGGSLQHSAPGDPLTWDARKGAAEIGLGDDITGLAAGFAGVLSIFCHNKTAILYGTCVDDWRLETVSNEAGAFAHTVQAMDRPVMLDGRGVRALTAVQRFGDFEAGTLSVAIEPLLDARLRRGGRPCASLKSRAKNQWRLFWNDGAGLVMDLSNPAAPAFMPIHYGRPVSACASVDGEGPTGETLLFGSDDGSVYELDRGNGFDGDPVPAFVRLAYNHLATPMRIKRFHKVCLDLDAAPNTRLWAVPDFSHGDPDLPSAGERALALSGGGGHWEESSWNQFLWSARAHGSAQAWIDGIGTDIGLTIASREAPAHTLHGLTVHYSPARLIR